MFLKFSVLSLSLLLPLLSFATPPGERVLELLSQVKTNTANHEDIADTHETLRAGICQSKTTSLSQSIALLRSRLAQAGGEAATPSTAEQQALNATGADAEATAADAASTAERTMQAAITEKHRMNDVTVYVNQMSQLSAVRSAISDGFKHHLGGFTAARHIRTLSQALYAAHAKQMNGYTSTLDMMLSMMERHAGMEEAKNAVREQEQGEAAANVLAAELTEHLKKKEEDHQVHALYDAHAERLYEAVAAVTKQLGASIALEKALDKEAEEAWTAAALERDALGQETDGMLGKLDDKTRLLKEEIRALGGVSKPNASSLIVAPDVELMGRLTAQLNGATHELKLWDDSCSKQGNAFVAAQEQRSSVVDRVNKLETWIQESLMTARSVVGDPTATVGEEGAVEGEEDLPLSQELLIKKLKNITSDLE